jgi:hypothetical protein
MKESSPPMMLKLFMQALNIVLMYLPVQTILQGKNKNVVVVPPPPLLEQKWGCV